jgi:DNA-binding transcriptional MerR regulator
VSVFARRSRLSRKALRLYERDGLLRPARVDPDNGYRWYHERQLDDARLIQRLRGLDMPLDGIALMLAAPPAERSATLLAYWAEVEHRIATQRHLVAHLRDSLDGRKGRYDMVKILERDIDEQLVLTEQRHTTVAGLHPWLPEAIGRAWETAPAYGGITGPILVIYHGVVDEDNDGPVEVCGPITPPAGTTVTHATRIEPAHREAYVRITKAQVAWPQIISAYDAVEQWIVDNGREIIGSPREVYFADFMNAGPDDEVVDIAFPVAPLE